MRKSRIVVAIALGCLCICACSIIVGPRLYTFWWRSFQIVDHDFPLQRKWCFEAAGDIRSTPVDYNGRIVIRTNQDLYILDAANGSLLWSVSLPLTWHTAPPVVKDDVVVVTHSQGASAFDLVAGRQLWVSTDNTSRTVTFPVAANDGLVVIVGGLIEGREIRTGKLLWHIDRLHERAGAIAVGDNEYLQVVFPDEIRTYNVKTGKLLQSAHTEGWSLQSWLFQDGVWYLERAGKGISAFSLKEQRALWSREDLELSDYLMEKHGDMLLIGLWGAQPVALSASTGNTLWEAKATITDTYETPLAMGDIVYVRGLAKKMLYALDMHNGNVIGYLEVGRPVIVSDNADYSLGPIRMGSSIAFAGDNRLCVYGE